MILYPNGDIYFGQQANFMKHGVGKLLEISGGFQEGSWDQDKLSGKSCRVFDEDRGDLYVGAMDENKRSGRGRLYDAERDEVYEGDFENNKRQGNGKVYQRDGNVFQGDFRANFREGPSEHVGVISQAEV